MGRLVSIGEATQIFMSEYRYYKGNIEIGRNPNIPLKLWLL
jgi:hypothetical protein